MGRPCSGVVCRFSIFIGVPHSRHRISASVTDFLIGTAGLRGSGSGTVCPRPARLVWMSVMICGISLVGTAFLEKYALARRVVAPRSSTESSAVMSVLPLRCAQNHLLYPIVTGIVLRGVLRCAIVRDRSEEPTSEIKSLMRISHDNFCVNKKKIRHLTTNINIT